MKRIFLEEELAQIDSRILEAMKDWVIITIHKGEEVYIPSTWDSLVYPYKYFEVYKTEDAVNPGEDENEIQCYMSCGWSGMDDEVVIVLTILGTKVLSGINEVGAEIYKFGSDKIKVYRKEDLVTDFTKPRWWNKWFGKPLKINKVIIRNVL